MNLGAGLTDDLSVSDDCKERVKTPHRDDHSAVVQSHMLVAILRAVQTILIHTFDLIQKYHAIYQ